MAFSHHVDILCDAGIATALGATAARTANLNLKMDPLMSDSDINGFLLKIEIGCVFLYILADAALPPNIIL